MLLKYYIVYCVSIMSVWHFENAPMKEKCYYVIFSGYLVTGLSLPSLISLIITSWSVILITNLHKEFLHCWHFVMFLRSSCQWPRAPASRPWSTCSSSTSPWRTSSFSSSAPRSPSFRWLWNVCFQLKYRYCIGENLCFSPFSTNCCSRVWFISLRMSQTLGYLGRWCAGLSYSLRYTSDNTPPWQTCVKCTTKQN